MAGDLQELFDNNRGWADGMLRRDPGFFTRLQVQQSPKYMWIGCADSRVPANELVGLLPGDVFVHRNVANVVVHSDLNCLSVIQFATDVLKVQHILVVGHSGCGGVAAVVNERRAGIVDNWLLHVQDVRNRHADWLDTLPLQRRVDALSELNVVEQAGHVCRTTVVQDAWQRGQSLVVHGCFYGLSDGLLNDLRMTVSSADGLSQAYAAAVAAIKLRYQDSVSEAA